MSSIVSFLYMNLHIFHTIQILIWIMKIVELSKALFGNAKAEGGMDTMPQNGGPGSNFCF